MLARDLVDFLDEVPEVEREFADSLLTFKHFQNVGHNRVEMRLDDAGASDSTFALPSKINSDSTQSATRLCIVIFVSICERGQRTFGPSRTEARDSPSN